MDAKNQSPQDKLKHDIETKAKRKMRSRSAGKQSPWFGLGMFGLVGWSVAIPTLLGIALGSWIDQRWPGSVSWTLTLLFMGVVIGGMNAWYWINKEANEDNGLE